MMRLVRVEYQILLPDRSIYARWFDGVIRVNGTGHFGKMVYQSYQLEYQKPRGKNEIVLVGFDPTMGTHKMVKVVENYARLALPRILKQFDFPKPLPKYVEPYFELRYLNR
jgi:hypothetical protein